MDSRYSLYLHFSSIHYPYLHPIQQLKRASLRLQHAALFRRSASWGTRHRKVFNPLLPQWHRARSWADSVGQASTMGRRQIPCSVWVLIANEPSWHRVREKPCGVRSGNKKLGVTWNYMRWNKIRRSETRIITALKCDSFGQKIMWKIHANTRPGRL